MGNTVNYEMLMRIGSALRRTDVKTLTVEQLYQILQRATGTIGRGTLKRYIQILKEEKFIKFNNNGLWEIIRKKSFKERLHEYFAEKGD